MNELEVRSVNFVMPGTVLICANNKIIINNIDGFTPLTQITGAQFKIATLLCDSVAAVAQEDTPPFTPFFLLIYNRETGKFIKSLEFPQKILKMETTKDFFFVSVESAIQIYDARSTKSISTIERSSAHGLFACSDRYLAFPDDRNRGIVTLVSIPEFSVVRKIQCHSGAIRSLNFSEDGKNVVTTSVKGTIVRLINVETGEKDAQYRRGMSHKEVIGLAASNEVVCAITKTIHIFTSSGKHISITPDSIPIACGVVKSTVLVPCSDGTISVYKVNSDGTYTTAGIYNMIPPTFRINSTN